MAVTASVGRYNWMRVVDVMTTDPLTVTPTETIGQADELMNTNRIRQLPVVEGKELVGIVTDRDIRSFLSGSLLEDPEAREKALTKHLGQRDHDHRAHHRLSGGRSGGSRGTAHRRKVWWDSSGGQIRGISGYCDLYGRAAMFLEPATRRLLTEKR